MVTLRTAPARGAARRSTAPRVGLYGLLGSGNLGNDGSAEVMINHLRSTYPGVVLEAICDGPAEVRRKFGIGAVRLHWNPWENRTANTPALVLMKALGKIVDAWRIAAFVRRQDAVIMAGMGAFEATMPLRPWGTPYSQFLVSASGRLQGRKVAFVSVGANDVSTRATRWLFVGAARCAHYVSFRDAYSRDAMRRAGLRARGDVVCPDLAFALPAPEGSATLTSGVGVGVLDYHGGNDDRSRAAELNATYRAKIVRLVHRLLDSGRDVRLFTGATVDDVVVQEVLADVGATRPDDLSRVHAEPAADLQELMTQMTQVDAVVATRYHNVVCALRLPRPTVSVGYARKNDEVMAASGLAEFGQTAKAFDVDRVLEQLDELAARRDELVVTMAARNAERRDRLEEQFERLGRVLFDRFAPARPSVPAATASTAPAPTTTV